MHKRLLSIIALTILVTSTLVGCSEAPSNSSTLTILSITEGTVLVMKVGTDEWTEATVEMTLEVGDIIKTGDDSGAEIVFFDGSTIELEAGTQIEITALDSRPDSDTKTITLMQTVGTTISRVTKLLDPASTYAIETPSGVAAVRGSVMIVRIVFNEPNYPDGTVLIMSLEGDIYYIGQGEELELAEGTQVVATSETTEILQLSLAVDDSAVTDAHTAATVAAPGVLANDSGLIVGDTLAVIAVDTGGTIGNITAWDADGSFTYDPNGQFEYLQTGSSTSDSFTYTVTDDYGITDTATVTIIINGVYEPPSNEPPGNEPPVYYPPVNRPPAAVDDAATTDEDNPVAVAAPGVLINDSDPDGHILAVIAVNTIGTIGNVTAWDADGSFTYDPNGQFEDLSDGSSTTDSFTYTVSDGHGGTDTATVTIMINGLNDSPTAMSLDNNSVAENQPSGTVVGGFSTTDPDTGDTSTYGLVSGDGDDDNAWFTIVGNQLQTAASFDYETKNSYAIRVRSTDQGALSLEEQFTISVTDVNETPATFATLNININTGANATIYIQYAESGQWVTNGDEETPANIPVTVGYRYCVWVEKQGYVYSVKINHLDDSNGVGGNTACGNVTANSTYQVHFDGVAN